MIPDAGPRRDKQGSEVFKGPSAENAIGKCRVANPRRDQRHGPKRQVFLQLAADQFSTGGNSTVYFQILDNPLVVCRLYASQKGKIRLVALFRRSVK
jgi:hypothetical protein